jgi:hypothetical protein
MYDLSLLKYITIRAFHLGTTLRVAEHSVWFTFTMFILDIADRLYSEALQILCNEANHAPTHIENALLKLRDATYSYQHAESMEMLAKLSLVLCRPFVVT